MNLTQLILLCSLAIASLAKAAEEAASYQPMYYNVNEVSALGDLAKAHPAYQEAERASEEAERASGEAKRAYEVALARANEAQKAAKDRYEAALEEAGRSQKVKSFEEAYDSRCYICLENFRDLEKFGIDQEMVKTKCCGHMTCAGCFDQAKAIKNQCPMCRKVDPDRRNF